MNNEEDKGQGNPVFAFVVLLFFMFRSEEEKKDFDSDALFDKHDSNKDGKLDGDEISSLILELFDQFRTEETNQESSSADEPVKVDSSEDEIQKLDRLYNGDICLRNVMSALSRI